LVFGGTVFAMGQQVPVVDREFFGLPATTPVVKYCQILQSYAQLLHLQHDLSYIRDMSTKADLALERRNRQKKQDFIEHLQAALKKVDAASQKEFIVSKIAVIERNEAYLTPGDGQVCGTFVLFLTMPKAMGTFLANRSLIMALNDSEPDHNLIRSLLTSDDEEVRFIGKTLMHQACIGINDRRVEMRALKDKELVSRASSLYDGQTYGGGSARYVSLIPRFFEFYRLIGQLRSRMLSHMQVAAPQAPSIGAFFGEHQQERQLVVMPDQQVKPRYKIDERCVKELERHNIERNIAIVAEYERIKNECRSLYEQTLKELRKQADILKKTGKQRCQKARVLADLLKDYDGQNFKDTLQDPTFLDDAPVRRPLAVQTVPSSSSVASAPSVRHDWIDPSLLRSTAKAQQRVSRAAKKPAQPAPSPTQACVVEPVQPAETREERTLSEQDLCLVPQVKEAAVVETCTKEEALAKSCQQVTESREQSPREMLLDSLSGINPYQDGTVQEVCPEYVRIEDTANRMHIYLFSNESNSRYSQGALRYTQYVNAWFNDARAALVDQGYLNPELRGRRCALTPESQLNAVQVHRFSKLVDTHIPTKGISYTKPSRKRAGVVDTYIALPGMIQYMDRMQTRPAQEYCVFVYIIDGQTGVCFHRNILFRTNQEIMAEFMQKGFYEVEFPPLDPNIH